VDRIRSSTIDEAEASARTLAFLAQWVEPNSSPMCGNSICQDRRFMVKHLPELAGFFHYRNLDVTTLKLLATYWRKDLPAVPKRNVHEALADIRESIEELRYYREHLVKMSG
jgi:oligoribonuclease